MHTLFTPRLAALALSLAMTAFTLATIDGLATGDAAGSQIAQQPATQASEARG